MLGQTFSQGWNYLGYLVEKKAYMARCENKARPELQCNGKCQLMKKILEQEKKERGQAPELKFSAKGDIISSRSFFTTNFPVANAGSIIRYIRHSIGVPIGRSNSLFHPPDLA